MEKPTKEEQTIPSGFGNGGAVVGIETTEEVKK